MNIYAPINEVGNDNSGMLEAEQAVMYSNGSAGSPDGFGSQGLSVLDTNAVNSCAGAISSWCLAFGSYYGVGSPLELQQASLSDPLDTTCTPPQSPGPLGCGASSTGADSGDLRIWLPFAIANHADVIELYYFDAALAFDPEYCTAFTGVYGSACMTGYTIIPGTFLTASQQGQFFNTVGQGMGCGTGIGLGDCSYANAINMAHGFH